MINKKFTLKKLLAIVMVVAVIFGCIGCTKDAGSNTDTGNNTNSNNDNNTTDKYEGLSDAEYFQTLMEESLSGTISALASKMGNYAQKGITSGDYGATAEVELLMGDAVISLLEAYAASSLGNVDFSFLSEVDLFAEIDTNSELTKLALSLGLTETEIIALNLIVSDNTVWAGFPDLSDAFLEVKLDQVIMDMNTEQADMAAELLDIFPEEKEIDRILSRYVSLALKEIDKVERSQTTLELDGLKQDVTQLSVNIYAEDCQDMLKVILTTAKDDESIKNILDDFSAFANEMGREESADWVDVDLCAQYSDAIDAMLAGALLEEIDADYYINANLYIDSKHNVVGISAARQAIDPEDADDEECFTFLKNYTVTEGENFKSVLEIRATNDEIATLAINGSGTNKKGAINGKYDIVCFGTPYLTAELKDFIIDWETVVGSIVLTPSDALMEMLSQSVGAIAVLDDIALELEFLIDDGLFGVAVDLVGKDALIVGIAVKLADRTAVEIEKPSNTVSALDERALASWISGLKIDSVIENLRDAGASESLITMLQTLALMSVV